MITRMTHDGVRWTVTLRDDDTELLATASGQDQWQALESARAQMRSEIHGARGRIPPWLEGEFPRPESERSDAETPDEREPTDAPED